MTTLPGNPLSDADYLAFSRLGIPRGLADQALLRRVSSNEGAEIVGRNGSGDYAGIIFPYIWPGELHTTNTDCEGIDPSSRRIPKES